MATTTFETICHGDRFYFVQSGMGPFVKTSDRSYYHEDYPDSPHNLFFPDTLVRPE